MTDHPKMVRVGPLAGWLYICGLTYCSRQLTDGFIPAEQVRRLADLKGPDALAKRLVTEGLWEPCDGGYRVHDYLEYQPTRERVLATRAVRATVGSLGGKQRASKSAANGKQSSSNLLEGCSAFASSQLQPRPGPSQPEPVETSPAGEISSAPPPPAGPGVRSFVPRAGLTQMPADWEPSAEDRGFASQHGMRERDIAHHAAKCRAHYRGHGEWRDNWSEVWRLWVLREIEGGPGAPRLPPLGEEDLPPMTDADRAADKAHKEELERRRQAYAAKQPSAEERFLQRARDDPGRPAHITPEQWVQWDPQMRKRMSKSA